MGGTTHRQITARNFCDCTRRRNQNGQTVTGIDVPENPAVRVVLAIEYSGIAIIAEAAMQVAVERCDERIGLRARVSGIKQEQPAVC